MKLNHLFPALLVMVAMSCSENLEPIAGEAGAGKGEVRFELSADPRNALITKGTEEGVEDVPVGDFWIEIYKQGVLRLYREKYDVAGNDFILLNEGEYLLRAKYGDSLGVGFNKPFYMAEKDFIVNPQTKETVSAVAKLANVKVKVDYSENMTETYPDYQVFVRNTSAKVKTPLKFTSTEVRAGYIPAGDLVIEVYADFKGDGIWRKYVSEPQTFLPNDFVTFHVDASALDGLLKVIISIDNAVDVVTKEVLIPESVTPQTAPITTVKAGVGHNAFVLEGTEKALDPLTFSGQAKAGISSVKLQHNSAILSSNGIPENIDFSNLTPDIETALKAAGISWSDNGHFAVVDLSDALPAIGLASLYEGKEAINSTFTFEIIDLSGKSSSTVANVMVYPNVQGTFSIQPYDVWATKVTNLKAEFTKGNTDLLTLQYSDNEGESWHDVVEAGKTRNSLTYDVLRGLTPNHDYVFRYVYDHEFDVLDKQFVRTERAAQIGNASFEEYRVNDFEYTIKIFGSKGTEIWYDLFANEGDAWWATNSSATLDKNITTGYVPYKCAPTIFLQLDEAAQGRVSVMIASVATDDWASELKYGNAVTGEVFIGKADNSDEHKGGHVVDGHAFPSRPSALTLKHKFNPFENDPYKILVEVRAEDGSIIGTGKVDDRRDAVGVWTELIVPINYSITDKKASSIYVSMKSSATDSKNSRKFSFNKLRQGPEAVKSGDVHMGSILYVDDVILTYE